MYKIVDIVDKKLNFNRGYSPLNNSLQQCCPVIQIYNSVKVHTVKEIDCLLMPHWASWGTHPEECVWDGGRAILELPNLIKK